MVDFDVLNQNLATSKWLTDANWVSKWIYDIYAINIEKLY